MDHVEKISRAIYPVWWEWADKHFDATIPKDVEQRAAKLTDTALFIARLMAVDLAVLPLDCFTHLGDFQNACQNALKNSPTPTVDQDDRSYWQHQLDTITKIREAMK